MPETLVVHSARLIDGRGGRPVDDAILIAQDGRIAYAGPKEGVKGQVAADRAIDADGRSLIPGLIDCHVHLVFDGENPDFAADADALTPEQARARCEEALRKHLEAGVATVRDLGGVYGATVEAAAAVTDGRWLGARVLTAIEVLTAPGGHAHFIGREVGSPDEMTKAVAELHEAGAGVIKVIATGGVLTPGIGATQSAFPDETLSACVQEAHARGLRVAAHAIGDEGIEAAVAAGVDSIEHGCFLGETSIEAMIGNPTWLVATLSAPERISNGGPGVPDYARDKSEEVQVRHRDSFARAVASGVRIASGTDAGTPYNFHGNLVHELRLMHEAGLRLDRVLQAATVEAAALLGLGDHGALESGYVADLVLLDGDPLSDIGAYERVSLVARDGRVLVER